MADRKFAVSTGGTDPLFAFDTCAVNGAADEVSVGKLGFGAAGSFTYVSTTAGLPVAQQGAWTAKLTDGTNLVGLTQGRNADNQAPSPTAYQLDVSTASGILNPCSISTAITGGFDRPRVTGLDGVPAAGIPAGSSQFGVLLGTTLNNAAITGGNAAQTVTVTSAASIKVGDEISVGGANPETIYVSAVSGSTITAVFAKNHAGTEALSWFHYNVARDAAMGDAIPLTGLSASMTYLWNTISNVAELDRSAAGERDGATGSGTAVAAEYEYNGAGPALSTGFVSGLAFDRARSLQAKGLAAATQSAGGALNTASITVSSAAAANSLQPGQQIRIDRGTASEESAYVATSYTPGTAVIPLQSNLAFAHTAATVEWDVFASTGPGLNGFTACGIGIEEEALYNPVDGKYYVERSSTQDAMPAPNIVAESAVVFNGATFDRLRSASAANLSATTGAGAGVIAGPGNWSATSAPVAATVATVTRAAGAAGVRHVCNAITASVSAGATAQTPINVYLRDGLTGAGTILWAGTLAAPANGSGVIALTGLNVVGSAATAMTLEFSAAGVAASLEAVTLGGFDAS